MLSAFFMDLLKPLPYQFCFGQQKEPRNLYNLNLNPIFQNNTQLYLLASMNLKEAVYALKIKKSYQLVKKTRFRAFPILLSDNVCSEMIT